MSPFKYLVTISALLLSFSSTSIAQDSKKEAESTPASPETLASTIDIQNEFLKIIVNQEGYDTGRFAIETILGDPGKESDDNQPLIYGRPKPWTSYTTVQVDGTNYVFGGPTKKRAGKFVETGTVISQTKVEDSITTISQISDIEVTQELSIIRNPLSRVYDTAMIDYQVKNTGKEPHKVGLRIMMDTLLGSNDGAPLRLGEGAYRTEKRFAGKERADYWQAFDQLPHPSIVAQGVLSDPTRGVKMPDKVLFANWGSLADEAWAVDYEEGRSFIRKGESETDSALALYWAPEKLAPGESRTYRTLYGVGGITVAAGDLSLGLAIPSYMVAGTVTPYTVVAYIFNSGGYDSKGTKFTLNLPEGIRLADDMSTTVEVGTIKAGESKQVALPLQISPEIETGGYEIHASVESDTLDSNEIKKEIQIQGTSVLKVMVSADVKKQESPPYMDIKLYIQNPLDADIFDVSATMLPLDNCQLADFEPAIKHTQSLSPKEWLHLEWVCYIEDIYSGNSSINWEVSSASTPPQPYSQPITWHPLSASLSLEKSQEIIEVGDYFYIEPILSNIQNFQKGDLYCELDTPRNVRSIRYTPSAVILEDTDSPLFKPYFNRNRLTFQDFHNDKVRNRLSLGKWHFYASTERDAIISCRIGRQVILKETIPIHSQSENNY